MLDVSSVALNTLWIAGCALILAAFSYSSWLAHVRGLRTRQMLDTRTFQLPLAIGLGLGSLGMFVPSRGWLEHLLWAILFLLSVWRILRSAQTAA